LSFQLAFSWIDFTRIVQDETGNRILFIHFWLKYDPVFFKNFIQIIDDAIFFIIYYQLVTLMKKIYRRFGI